MKNFKSFITENNTQSEKILFIVDVQKEFSKFLQGNLVEELFKYCKEFDTVYQIWDSNKASKPSYKFPNEKGAYIKKYGTTFSDDFEKVAKDLNAKYPNAKTGDIFEFDDVDSYVVRVKNNHGWFYVPKALSDLFKSLKNMNVVCTGGSFGECILDVFEAMQAFGIIPKYNMKYIYSAKNTSNDRI